MRKLEYLAADALAQGCDTLVSIGGVQSNHTRQVAAVAAHLGLGVRARAGALGRLARRRLRQGRQHPALADHGRRRAARSGAASTSASGRAGSRRSPTSRTRGGKPYAIPAGASDHPLGGLGFARWADEVAEQERELGVFFDTIVVCSVTGSTQAGMIAGFAAQERPRRVLGIDGSATVEQTWEQVARIARRTAEAIGLGRELRDDEIVLLDEWHAGTYGIPDAKTIEAIRLCARLEGMLTDPVYEGKSMAALIDLVRDGAHRAGLARALRAPRRPARAERLRRRVLSLDDARSGDGDGGRDRGEDDEEIRRDDACATSPTSGGPIEDAEVADRRHRRDRCRRIGPSAREAEDDRRVQAADARRSRSRPTRRRVRAERGEDAPGRADDGAADEQRAIAERPGRLAEEPPGRHRRAEHAGPETADAGSRGAPARGRARSSSRFRPRRRTQPSPSSPITMRGG